MLLHIPVFHLNLKKEKEKSFKIPSKCFTVLVTARSDWLKSGMRWVTENVEIQRLFEDFSAYQRELRLL